MCDMKLDCFEMPRTAAATQAAAITDGLTQANCKSVWIE